MKLKLVIFMLFSVPAIASVDSANTVHFNGEVSSQTCSVNINGTEVSPVVLQPTVSVNELNTAGAAAGDTVFTVNLTGCSTATSDTAIKTVFVANNPTANGNQGNAGDVANVAIQLRDSDASTPLSFSAGSAVHSSAMTLTQGATSTSQDRVARYYAEGSGVSAGSVIASAQFAITYK